RAAARRHADGHPARLPSRRLDPRRDRLLLAGAWHAALRGDRRPRSAARPGRRALRGPGVPCDQSRGRPSLRRPRPADSAHRMRLAAWVAGLEAADGLARLRPGDRQWLPARIWRRVGRDPVAIAAIVTIVVVVLAAVLAPMLAPYEPTRVNPRLRL